MKSSRLTATCQGCIAKGWLLMDRQERLCRELRANGACLIQNQRPPLVVVIPKHVSDSNVPVLAQAGQKDGEEIQNE